MISPSTPWSPKQQKSGATIKLPEKASKPICHSPCKTKLIQKPGEQTQPGSALRCTGQDGVGALIKQHQPGPRATRTSWLFPIRTKETGSWGEEGSSTNWCLKKTTNTHLQQIHSYYRLKNCLNFPPTFSSKKKPLQRLPRASIMAFSPPPGATVIIPFTSSSSGLKYGEEIQPFTLWPGSAGLSFPFCKMDSTVSSSPVSSLEKQTVGGYFRTDWAFSSRC